MRGCFATIGITAIALAAWALPAGATESADERMAISEEMQGAPEEAPAKPAPAQAAGMESPAKPAAAESGEFGEVVRASFATAMEEREPVDQVTTLSSDHDQVYFFTELRGLEGHTLEHVWEHDGQEVARVPFYVGGPRWRVYSSKQLQPGWTGEWTVTVVDEEGHELHQEGFSFVPTEEALPASTE